MVPALLFLVLRAHDSDTATRLSGMAQSVGYALADSDVWPNWSERKKIFINSFLLQRSLLVILFTQLFAIKMLYRRAHFSQPWPPMLPMKVSQCTIG